MPQQQDLWSLLAERTHAWAALNRQALADAVWDNFVTARYARTGDPRGLEFLYPYLHSRADTRAQAIGIAARIYEGQGPDAIADLDYFLRNTDPFIRDRAVQIVAACVVGHPEDVVLDTLAPYLHHPGHFVQRQAMDALGQALAGSASERAYAEIERIKTTTSPNIWEVDWAIANLCSGRPTEAAFTALVRPGDEEIEPEAVGTLVRGADEAWYERACRELFEPYLHTEPRTISRAGGYFDPRDGVEGLCAASPGRGIEPLRKMLHLLNKRVNSYAVLQHAPICFRNADPDANKAPIMELARSDNVQEQRIAAVCLGTMMTGREDQEGIDLLRELTASRNGALRAAAFKGLGLAARYSGDEELGRRCLDAADDPETARAALAALGLIFQGSGRFDLFDQVRAKAEAYRQRQPQGRKQYRPLIQTFLTAGLIYQGTGSTEPLDFLLEGLKPTPLQWCAFRGVAAKGLVMVEFPESTLVRIWGEEWI